MSILQTDLSKKLHNAAINQAVADLVSATQSLSQGKKRLKKNKDYEVVMASLQQFGVTITKEVLHQRVTRALKSIVPKELTEINLPSSACSNASTLTSETASPAASPMTTSPTTTTTPTIATSPVTKAGCPKGSSAVQKRRALITVRECIDEIVLEYSQELALYKSVGRCVNKRYLKTLIEKKKKQYKVSSQISLATV